ncbi:acetyltransferase [Polaribacter vadi]|uniref:Acetyltransferase n=1 Tax=Polaribacter vadi TaxID=1774273 RepID=A0A1B8TYV6_9FLAO|nr:acetyltransferase [Polaribacter vadi]AOW17233.1 acetyltransferase [Polaribacter vadi]OBY64841.1 acetyltransferase [Polaribacter vadi]
MSKLCLYGASGHGKVIKDIVLSTNKEVQCFFDDYCINKQFLGLSVFSSDEIKTFEKNEFIISIGDNSIRKIISKKLTVQFAKVIHKKAIVSKDVEIGKGTVVMAGAIINANVKIGKHCIINTNAVVEHDCFLEDFVHISPSATITGNVTINEGAHIGAAATIIPNIKIGKWATVGAGAVVLKDVPEFAIVVGNPARIIKYKEKENE